MVPKTKTPSVYLSVFIFLDSIPRRWYPEILFKPELSDFYLDLHRSLADRGLAKSLDRSTGMPVFFANPSPSRFRHTSSGKIAQFRLKARSSGGERYPDTVEVVGSNPTVPTSIDQGFMSNQAYKPFVFGVLEG